MIRHYFLVGVPHWWCIKCINILLRSSKGTSLNKNYSCKSCIFEFSRDAAFLKPFLFYILYTAQFLLVNLTYIHTHTYTYFLHFYYASMLVKKHFLTKLFKLWGHWLRPQGQCSGWSSLRRWWGFALNRRIYSLSKYTSLKRYIHIHNFIFI